MRKILESAVISAKKSQYWQEEVVSSGLASVDEFFYDTYLGNNPEVLEIQNANTKV